MRLLIMFLIALLMACQNGGQMPPPISNNGGKVCRPPAEHNLWVDSAKNTGLCVTGSGTQADPFCTLLEAADVVNNSSCLDDQTPWVITVNAEVNVPYTGIELKYGPLKTVVIQPRTGVNPIPITKGIDDSFGFGIEVSSGVKLILKNALIISAKGGIECRDYNDVPQSSLTLENVSINESSFGIMTAVNCDITVNGLYMDHNLWAAGVNIYNKSKYDLNDLRFTNNASEFPLLNLDTPTMGTVKKVFMRGNLTTQDSIKCGRTGAT